MTRNESVQSPALPPVDLIGPDRRPPRPRRTASQVGAEVLKTVPNLAKLMYRLMRDDRVPTRTKVIVGAAGVYFASPVDLIPELLFPIVGRVDDLIVLAFATDRLLRSVDREVIEELWDGDGDALDVAAALIAWASNLMPGPLRRMLAD